MKIDCTGLHHKVINEQLLSLSETDVVLENCIGQRFIAAGLSGKNIEIYGIPGNALGAYLDGSSIRVYSNVQDAIGDTMNEGNITVFGSCGDAPGYAMRGGKIMIKGDVGYRCGIHMKEYNDKVPVILIGGVAGSFLGEYQAGGRIVVLGLGAEEQTIVGNFCGTGMHGGSIYLRTTVLPPALPEQVSVRIADKKDKEVIRGDVEEFCSEFGGDAEKILNDSFYVLTPNTKNPYKRLYTSY